MKIYPVIACAVLPLLFCRCGGKETAEVDSVETVKAALFPTISPDGEDVPAEVLEAVKGKTWGDVIATCSEESPVWKTEVLPEMSGYSGVKVDVVIMGEAGWVKFKVSDDGGIVTAFQVGSGDEIDTDDEEEIAMGFASLFAVKAGGAGAISLLEKAKSQAMANKNMQILKGTSMVARVFSLDNDGVYPTNLEELSSIEEAGPFKRPTDPSTGKEVDPIYFGGLSEESAGHLMLLACPFTNSDGTRTVVFMDSSAQNIPEAEYQKKLAKQKQ